MSKGIITAMTNRSGLNPCPLAVCMNEVCSEKSPLASPIAVNTKSEQLALQARKVPPVGFEPTAFCSGGRRSIP